MSVTYDEKTLTLHVDDREVSRALGALKSKTPAVMKVAINSTARQAARDIVRDARARYDLTPRGRERLRDYKQQKKATNASLSATLHGDDKGLPLNLTYFRHSPERPYMGKAAMQAPGYFRSRVLRSGRWHNLTGDSSHSKGFLVSIHNGRSGNDHIAAVQRVLNSYTDNVVTRRGFPRWADGTGRIDPKKVEKIYDMDRLGVSSMGKAVWELFVEEEAAENLSRFLERRIGQVLDRAARTGQ